MQCEEKGQKKRARLRRMHHQAGRRRAGGRAGGQAHPPRVAALDAVLDPKLEQGGGGRARSAGQAVAGGALCPGHHLQQVTKVFLGILRAAAEATTAAANHSRQAKVTEPDKLGVPTKQICMLALTSTSAYHANRPRPTHLL